VVCTAKDGSGVRLGRYRIRYGVPREQVAPSSDSTLAQATLPVADYLPVVAKQTYWKVPFEWKRTVRPRDDPLSQDWSWLNGRTSPEPTRLIADVLTSSPGPEDRYAVEVLGAEEAARRTLALAAGFSYLPDRWHVLSVREQTAGFVLPVIYDGCARDGLDEATIYHMGVSPAHRGTGIGRLLLRHATWLLLTHGVWRIYCDTPSNNAPMIHLFESEGWTRLPAHERPIAL
jgi:GNAT superfamily N-acetyltransferase